MTIFESIDSPDAIVGETDMDIISEIVRQGQNRELFDEIRYYRSIEDNYYKELKSLLPVLAPFGTFSYRDSKHLVATSIFLYFDIDNIPDVTAKKKEIITKYGDKIYMLCISASGAGLSMFVKIDRSYVLDEFCGVYSYVKAFFKDLDFDECIGADGDIARGWYISNDPEVFTNKGSCFHLPIDIPYVVPKLYNNTKVKDSTLNLTLFEEHPFDEVMENTVTKTRFRMKNDVVDNVDREYLEIKWWETIPDGKKHKIYPGMTFKYLRLNPLNGIKYAYSFMKYINDTYAKPPMKDSELRRIVSSCVQSYDENVTIKTKRKGLLFNDARLTRTEKRSISNQINGIKRKKKSVDVINEVRDNLIAKGIVPTQVLVSKMTGISRQTVNRHWEYASLDKELNDKLDLVNKTYKNRVIKLAKNIDSNKLTDYNDNKYNNAIKKDSTLNLTPVTESATVRDILNGVKKRKASREKAAQTKLRNKAERTKKALLMLKEKFGIGCDTPLRQLALKILNDMNTDSMKDLNGGVLDSRILTETLTEGIILPGGTKD